MSTGKHRVEAALFAARATLPEGELSSLLERGERLPDILMDLAADYAERGVCLQRTASGWALRTRPEASDLAASIAPKPPRLTRAAMETLAVIACHQPVTRPEIERVRDVSLHPGVFDALLEADLIKPGRRRDTPGRPLTWITTDTFLETFDLLSLDDLQSLTRMRADGLLTLPPPPSALQGDPA